MTTAQALVVARRLLKRNTRPVCDGFRLERDGNLHFCEDCCGTELEHVVQAFISSHEVDDDTLAAVRWHLVDAINAAGHVETRSQVQADAVTHLESKIDDLLREIDVMTVEPEDER